jgi:DNA invertase Pin-like site-specific DNA recombinase
MYENHYQEPERVRRTHPSIRSRSDLEPRRTPAGRRSSASHTASAGPPDPGVTTRPLPVVGYASSAGPWRAGSPEVGRQLHMIREGAWRRGLTLLELIGEREPAKGKALGRPGLARALELIASRKACGLVVASLARLTSSTAELGEIIEWLARFEARFVAVVPQLDTARADGRFAAEVLVEVSRSERARLTERTRSGLLVARQSGRTTGRPAVTDDPNLKTRIAQMRARGMTLQAIADQLNEDRVPTVRGGAKWRHSSVQVAAGYRRPQRPPGDRLLGGRPTQEDRDPDHG